MATYKERILNEIENAAKLSDASLKIFFDVAQTPEARLSAFKLTGTFNKEEELAQALALFRNKEEDPRIRAAAINGLVQHANTDDALLHELVAVLQDENAHPAMRAAALSVLQGNTFSSPVFGAVQPAYNNALRTLVDSYNKDLQSTAIEYLALDRDEYVQRRLIDGLENPDKKIAAPEVAIHLLSYDLHADHFPLLRKIVENPPNQLSKKEALRSLAADAGSADLLFKTLNNATEDAETRHVCAVALQNMNPASKELAGSYKKILTDSAEDKGLKTALLNTLTFSAQGNILDDDADFQQKLDEVPNKHIDDIKLLTGTEEVSNSAKKKISEFDQMLQQYKSSVEKRKSAQ
jgi:hypothetical protein